MKHVNAIEPAATTRVLPSTTRPTIASAVRAAIWSHPYYHEVKALADQCGGTAYWVGGKVYRTIAQFEWGWDFNPRAADWDIFIVGADPQKIIQRTGWKQIRGHGTPEENLVKKATYRKRHSMEQVAAAAGKPVKESSIKWSKKFELATNPDVSVDLIFEQDLVAQYPGELLRGVNLYLQKVPLDIQAIAIPFGTDDLLGHGLEAIQKKEIRVQNPTKVVTSCDVNTYAQEKTVAFRQAGFALKLWNQMDQSFTKDVVINGKVVEVQPLEALLSTGNTGNNVMTYWSDVRPEGLPIAKWEPAPVKKPWWWTRLWRWMWRKKNPEGCTK